MKTVNFIEAINSGQRFKLTKGEWLSVNRRGQVEIDFSRTVPVLEKCFYLSQFEIEEKKIEITESEFDEAISKAGIFAQAKTCKRDVCEASFLRKLTEELGF